MIALKILAVWLIAGTLVALSLGRTEPQEHARIKNASDSSANGDDVVLNHFGDVL